MKMEITREEQEHILKGLQELIDGLCRIKDIFTNDENLPENVQQISRKNCSEQTSQTESERVDIEDIRKILVQKTKQGKGANVKELLGIFKVEKLSDVPEENFSELFQMANKL